MCGRFTLTHRAEEIAEHFEVHSPPTLSPRYNIAPTQEICVLRSDGNGQRSLGVVRWGLIPSWAKDRKIASRLINARSETVAEKPAFRSALRRRRCLIPASGFYEWSGKKGAKTPHFFHRPDGGLLVFAGLWESWQPPPDEESGAVPDPVETATILTTEANARIRPLHHRMPVILEPRDWARWLDPEQRDAEPLVSLLVPGSPDQIDERVVSTRINDVRNDDASCLEEAP